MSAFVPSRHFSRDHMGRLEVSLCDVSRGFPVVWPTLEHASRAVARGARLEQIEEDELPAADEDEDLVAIARLWAERQVLLAGQREEQDLRISLRNVARWFRDELVAAGQWPTRARVA